MPQTWQSDQYDSDDPAHPRLHLLLQSIISNGMSGEQDSILFLFLFFSKINKQNGE